MNSARGYMVLIGLGLALVLGWTWMIDQIWPPAPPKPKPDAIVLVKARDEAGAGAVAGVPLPNKETVVMLLGGYTAEIRPVALLPEIEKPTQEAIGFFTGSLGSSSALVSNLRLDGLPKQPEVKPRPEVKPVDSGELIGLGRGENPFYIQTLFNTKGGSVQQIVLTEFDESDREGLRVVKNGKPQALQLVPGIRIPRALSVRAERDIINHLPELKPGRIDAFTAGILSPQSFQMYHYEKPGDERPVLTLGEKIWTIVEEESIRDPALDEQKLVFQTDLDEPYNLRIIKTYTMKRKDYHIGLKVEIKRRDGKTGPNQFRYQLVGANGLPIEGEWYTSTFRQAIVGFGDDQGHATRYIEDAPSVRLTEGGDRQTRTDKLAIRYAAIAVQYFASAIAVDNEQPHRKFIEFVRATPVNEHAPLKAKIEKKEPKDWQYWEFLDDVTVRAVTESFNPDDVTHKYMLYHGPVKTRLLGLMPESKAVDETLVHRYLDDLNLSTLTDAPMPNALGRFASAIYWTDLVIVFTNLVHYLLWALYQVVPNRGICILIVTLMVRGMLFPLSRRQAHNGKVMQEKMAKLQPELRKLQDKYKDDFQGMNAARMQLYRDHNVNPFAAMSGCVLLLLQMPIFMGLYYALQESVFFRLDPFLWIPNLAAPDMLVFWTESIPFISTPSDIGSTLYLGPYFNVLPVVAVALMLYQQVKMMPNSDDPQVQSQQKMMKFMMVLFGFFFYKVAAGLCLYFIASTLWGLLERKLLPKPVKPEELEDGPAGAAPGPGSLGSSYLRKELEEEKPLGWWGRKKKEWGDKWKDVLEQAQKQHEFRREPGQQAERDKGKKKKKKK